MKNFEYHGIYRAKVVDNNDPEKFGRIMVWIPDIMGELPETEGIWALPANNPIGGRNSESTEDSYYAGTSYIPTKNSWVLILFEKGNINRPYYFAALNLKNAKVLPENQLGSNPFQKWVIFKSHDGRCIVISDDPDDSRIEITGKKRQISTPPSGDTNSVYTIDDNQTTIFFDERDGKQKVLIRTYKGDFFHIDIDQQKLQAYFKSGIEIKSDGDIKITGKNIHLKSTNNLNCESGSNLNLKSGDALNCESGDDLSLKAGANLKSESVMNYNVMGGLNINEQATGSLSLMSAATISVDAPIVSSNGGTSTPATNADTASSASVANPKGERDT